jgi:hypothetical protein
MGRASEEFLVYVEAGKRRAFAAAIDWPGWCRAGRDEPGALQALFAFGPRYAAALARAGLRFERPTAEAALSVIERLVGDATTDFGAPAIVPSCDEGTVGQDRDRFAAVLRACWSAFEHAAAAADGKELAKGPRGGGRDLPAVVRHVVEGNRAYLGKVAWRPSRIVDASPDEELPLQLDAALGVLDRAAAGDHPSAGPRGGKLWPARFFVRRVAWHMLDHAWELEDRVN